MAINENEIEDFSKYFKPEPGMRYSIIITDWHKVYDNYKGESRPGICSRVVSINGNILRSPKEWTTTALSVIAPLLLSNDPEKPAPIFKAQRLGYNALQITLIRKTDNRYVIEDVLPLSMKEVAHRA